MIGTKYIYCLYFLFFLQIFEGNAQKSNEQTSAVKETSKIIPVPKSQQKKVAPVIVQSATSNKIEKTKGVLRSGDQKESSGSRLESVKMASPEPGNPNWIKSEQKVIYVNEKGQAVKKENDN